MSATTITTTAPPAAAAPNTASPKNLQWVDEIGRVSVGGTVMMGLLALGLLRAFKVLPDDPLMSDIIKLYGTLATIVVGFYYGSSSGSKTKSNQIANQLPPPPEAPLVAGSGTTTIIKP